MFRVSVVIKNILKAGNMAPSHLYSHTSLISANHSMLLAKGYCICVPCCISLPKKFTMCIYRQSSALSKSCLYKSVPSKVKSVPSRVKSVPSRVCLVCTFELWMEEAIESKVLLCCINQSYKVIVQSRPLARPPSTRPVDGQFTQFGQA